MLARRHLREAALLAERLHLEEGDERADLLLDGLEADERVELGLELVERANLLGARAGLRLQAVELLGEPLALRAGALPQPLAEAVERTPSLLERVQRHAGTVPRARTRDAAFPRDVAAGATAGAWHRPRPGKRVGGAAGAGGARTTSDGHVPRGHGRCLAPRRQERSQR